MLSPVRQRTRFLRDEKKPCCASFWMRESGHKSAKRSDGAPSLRFYLKSFCDGGRLSFFNFFFSRLVRSMRINTIISSIKSFCTVSFTALYLYFGYDSFHSVSRSIRVVSIKVIHTAVGLIKNHPRPHPSRRRPSEEASPCSRHEHPCARCLADEEAHSLEKPHFISIDVLNLNSLTVSQGCVYSHTTRGP